MGKDTKLDIIDKMVQRINTNKKRGIKPLYELKINKIECLALKF